MSVVKVTRVTKTEITDFVSGDIHCGIFAGICLQTTLLTKDEEE